MAADYNLPDPTARVRPPRSHVHGVREQRTLTRDQVGALLAHVGQQEPARLAEVTVLAMLGLRAGELYALRWEDVDRARELIHVQRGISWGIDGPAELSTKTGVGRTVPLTEDVARVLLEHRASLVRQQHLGLSSGLVFPARSANKWGTWHRQSSALNRVLDNASRALGWDLRLRPQVLRRTCNTLLVRAGIDPKTVQCIMGHTSGAMTSLYTGVSEDYKRAATLAVFGGGVGAACGGNTEHRDPSLRLEKESP